MQGQEAIPQLREALKSSEPKVRVGGLLALIYMPKPDARLALAEVMRLCDDEDADVQSNALVLAARLCQDPTEIVSLTASRLLSSDPQITTAAQISLAELGSIAIPAVLEVLPQTRPSVHATCLGILAEKASGDHAEKAVTEAIVRGLANPDPIIRNQAFQLTTMSRKLTPEEATLGLNDSDSEIVLLVLSESARENCCRPQDLPRLAEILKTEPELHELALKTMADQGQDAAAYLTEIESFTKDRKPAMRRAAAAALVRVSGDFDRARPVLRGMLSDSDPDVVRYVAELWFQNAPEELPALAEDVLLPRLASANEPAQVSAAAALAGMPQVAVPHRVRLVRMLSDKSADSSVPLSVQVQLALVLGNMGSAAEDALPAVLGLAQRMDPRDDRISVPVMALGNIGTADPAVLDTLFRLHRRIAVERSETRVAVALALGKLGRGNATAVKLLNRDAMYAEDTRVRLAALKALGQANADKEALQETLEFLLSDEEVNIRLAACALLVQQCRYQEITMDVAMLIEDDNPLVRLLAARSLESLGKDAVDALPSLSWALDEPGNLGSLRNYEDEEIHWDLMEADLGSLKDSSVRQAVIAAIDAIENGGPLKTAHR